MPEGEVTATKTVIYGYIEVKGNKGKLISAFRVRETEIRREIINVTDSSTGEPELLQFFEISLRMKAV